VLLGVIESAELGVVLPNGKQVVIKMSDDGLHLDGAPNDGEFGANFASLDPGNYLTQAIVTGTTPEGKRFIRTAQHLMQISALEMKLTGISYLHYNQPKTKTNIELLIDIDDIKLKSYPEEMLTVRAYAEVYGSTSDGLHYIPVAWVQAMVDPVDIYGKTSVVVLDLEENWVKMANAYPPFQLRNVMIQDRDTNAILSERKIVFVQPLSNLQNLNDRLNTMSAVSEISEKMRVGPRPTIYSKQNSSTVAAGGKLLLVHGYCSASVWPPQDFTDYVVFEDYVQSRSNDEFALLIKKQGDQYPSFSVAAHSQGGLASLHLKTYYWSALDSSPRGPGASSRAIQSIGSPYRGCSLAGLLADIGWLFGFGCGSNFDLSTDGATLWYSKIPKHASGPESDVYYYTTIYDDSWWISGYCVTAANLILYTPNDGTCEIKNSKLTSGHFMGTTIGQCHTSGMRYPGQTYDKARNKEININASR